MEPDQKPAAPDGSPADAQGADYNDDEAPIGGIVGSTGAKQSIMASLDRAINAGLTFCGAQRADE